MSTHPETDQRQRDPIGREDVPNDADERGTAQRPRTDGDDDFEGQEITTAPGGQGGDVREEPDRVG